MLLPQDQFSIYSTSGVEDLTQRIDGDQEIVTVVPEKHAHILFETAAIL